LAPHGRAKEVIELLFSRRRRDDYGLILPQGDGHPDDLDARLYVEMAFWEVRRAKKQRRARSAKETQDALCKLAKAYGTIMEAAESDEPRLSSCGRLPGISAEQIRERFRHTARLAYELEDNVEYEKGKRKGGKVNVGREVAVFEAYHLVRAFSGEKPSGTRGGLWNAVANLLFGTGDDLHYMIRKVHKAVRKNQYYDPNHWTDVKKLRDNCQNYFPFECHPLRRFGVCEQLEVASVRALTPRDLSDYWAPIPPGVGPCPASLALTPPYD
jgi:hypothetical protein